MDARIVVMDPTNENITLQQIGERGWLTFLEKKLGKKTSSSLLVPIGDDAAVLDFPTGKKLVISSDAMVEGTHFRRQWLGWKGLAARSILAAASDITAMGGTPLGITISLGVPGEIPINDLEQFAEGLLETSERFQLDILGGDTVASQHIFVDVCVIGSVTESRIHRQQGARVGDALWVTGSLGRSQASLLKAERLDAGKADLDDPCWRPPARWSWLDAIRQVLQLHAITDLSDGLARDLEKILRHQPLDARINLEMLPIDPFAQEVALQLGKNADEVACIGGEDYELLLVEAGNSFDGKKIVGSGIYLQKIGGLIPGSGKIHFFRNGSAVELSERLFEHFVD